MCLFLGGVPLIILLSFALMSILCYPCKRQLNYLFDLIDWQRGVYPSCTWCCQAHASYLMCTSHNACGPWHDGLWWGPADVWCIACTRGAGGCPGFPPACAMRSVSRVSRIPIVMDESSDVVLKRRKVKAQQTIWENSCLSSFSIAKAFVTTFLVPSSRH